MTNEKYSVESIVQILSRITGIQIKNGTIWTAENIIIGIKTQGKIDFLVKMGYEHKIGNPIKEEKESKDNFEEKKKKKKKNGKIDAISGVKSIMKMSNFKNKK